MRANAIMYGLHPADHRAMVWRAFNIGEPTVTIAHGVAILTPLERIYGGTGGMMFDTWTVSGAIKRCSPSVDVDYVDNYLPRWPTRQTRPCGRLYCAKATPHTHRKIEAGDIVAFPDVAVTDMDAWPFVLWGEVIRWASTDDDDAMGDVLVRLPDGRDEWVSQTNRHRAVRRLRPNEVASVTPALCS